jgi:hypothetical protein
LTTGAAAPALERGVERDRARLVLILIGLGLLVLGALAGGEAAAAAAFIAAAMGMVGLLGSRLLGWRTLIVVVAAALLFVPVRQIVIQMDFIVDPEVYRLALLGVLGVWVVGLLVDPAVRLRSTRFDWPLATLYTAVLLSIVVNPGLVNLYQANVIKALFLFTSFLLFYYLVASVLTTRADVELMVRILVAATTALAGFAVVESVTDSNAFVNLGHLPFVEYIPPLDVGGEVERFGANRVSASSEHPIALGALFALIVPLSIYLARSARLWLFSTALLLVGVGATVSRTPVIMLVVAFVVYLVFRPIQTVRFLPALPIVFIASLLLVPSLVRPTIDAFFPSGGLVGSQANELNEGGARTVGRLADIKLTVPDIEASPVVGHGIGTRVIDPFATARYLPDGRYGGILDNQWLASLLEIGFLGIGALLWLMVRAARSLMAENRRRHGADPLLAASFAASILSFGVGMLFFDAFAFTQVTFMFFFVLALTAVFLRSLTVLPALPRAPRRPLIPSMSLSQRRQVKRQLQRLASYSARHDDRDA